MKTDSCSQRFNPPRYISRLKSYFRIFFALAFLIIVAFWLDYWLRGEMGIAEKFAARERKKRAPREHSVSWTVKRTQKHGKR